MLWPIFYDQVAVIGPQRPVTTEILRDMFVSGHVDALLTAPSVVEDISQNEDYMSALGSLKAVAFGGGPLSQRIGDLINTKTKLILYMGTSEAGWLTAVETDKEE